MQSHGQPLKQEGSFSAVLCDDSGASLPISCTSSMACWLHDPPVSMATGKQMCVFLSPWYFVVLLPAACLAAVDSGAQIGLGKSIIIIIMIIYTLGSKDPNG